MKAHVIFIFFILIVKLTIAQDVNKLQEHIKILQDSILILKQENSMLTKQLAGKNSVLTSGNQIVSRRIKFEAIPIDKNSKYAVHYLDKDEKSLSLFITGDWNFVFETANPIQNLQLKAYAVGYFGNTITVNIYVDGKLVKTDTKKLEQRQGAGPDVLINLGDVK